MKLNPLNSMNKSFYYIGVSLLIVLCSAFHSLAYGNTAQESGLEISSPNPFKPQLPKKPKKEIIKETNYTIEGHQQRASVRTSPSPQPEVRQERIPQPRQPTTTLNLNITGLVWNSERPQAIINDQVVSVGDTINDMKIVKIGKTGVEVSYQGETLIIKP